MSRPDPSRDGPDGALSARRTRWIRRSGAVGVPGSVLFFASLVLQWGVPQPDSYQFDPALTSPQFVLSVIAPGLTVIALACHLCLLGGVWLRDGGLGDARRYGRLALLGWGGTAGGVTLALLGYLGLFTFGQGTGIGSTFAGAGFALLALLGIAAIGLGCAAWGIGLLLAGDRRRSRLIGGLLLAVPIAGGLGLAVDSEVSILIVPLPYALSFAVLGYDLWEVPDPSEGD